MTNDHFFFTIRDKHLENPVRQLKIQFQRMVVKLEEKTVEIFLQPWKKFLELGV